jgi:hypothetical protein
MGGAVILASVERLEVANFWNAKDCTGAWGTNAVKELMN